MTTQMNNQEWLKILGKGMVTLPKPWREEFGFQPGDVVRAQKSGSKIIIESGKTQSVPYRLYTKKELEQFLKDDQLPKKLAEKIDKNIANTATI